MFASESIRLTTGGRPLGIHLFSTGQGKDKRRFVHARFKGALSLVDTVLDRRFTDWLPIWVMVIEHPEGVFVVDTGERAEASHASWFRSAGRLPGWFVGSQFKFAVGREDEVDRNLATLHIPIDKVKAVVLTHLHFDHTGGLHHFPNTPVLLHRLEWQRPYGVLPKLYPPGFQPTLLDLEESYGPFKKVHYLTASRDLALVHTPGHTHGHCSVLLRSDTCHILFAGDICYTQSQLVNEKYAANAADYKAARETYAAVKAFAHENILVFLPSHDSGSGLRLKAKILTTG
jgi:N-acyl homoserine lactone hydrolase